MFNRTALVSFFFGKTVFEGTWSNLALLLLRFYGGWTIMGAGLDKLPMPDWMVEQVIEIGFPFPDFFGWLACFSEFAFGALLCLGLLTRLSGFMLAFTMGVASFLFQDVTPLLDMHIAQHFFWIFALFAVIGGGNFSVDHYIFRSTLPDLRKLSMVALPTLALFLTLGLYLENRPVEMEMAEGENTEQTLFVAGSFNEWNPGATQLEFTPDSLLTVDFNFAESGPIQFKFVANGDWSTNFGILEQKSKGFPLDETAVLDEDNNTQNIEAYIPEPGLYRFTFDAKTLAFSLTKP